MLYACIKRYLSGALLKNKWADKKQIWMILKWSARDEDDEDEDKEARNQTSLFEALKNWKYTFVDIWRFISLEIEHENKLMECCHQDKVLLSKSLNGIFFGIWRLISIPQIDTQILIILLNQSNR